MESQFYRENLEGILSFTGGVHVLTVSQVGQYTGLKKAETVRRHFPYFVDNLITAETLAKCLCGNPPKNSKKKVLKRWQTVGRQYS